jgi:exonuclease SbcD
MSVKVLHFADAHIDIATGGRRDSKSGLSIRTLDFLKALDTIVDSAIDEKVDLVLFAGDAYRDSVPGPTFQREWGRRMMRLAAAQIPTLMIAGNHDSSNSMGKASALQEYDTLLVPYLNLARKIELWTPDRLDGVPVQVLTVPWIARARFVAMIQSQGKEVEDLNREILHEIEVEIENALKLMHPDLPLILLAHYPVVGAVMANQQMVSLGSEVTLSKNLVQDPRITYTALGHIHKFQDLNKGNQPPVIYPGSIERVNLGEIEDDKGFVIATLENGTASYRFRKMEGRKFFSREIALIDQESFNRLGQQDRKNKPYQVCEPQQMQELVLAQLPNSDQLKDSITRLIVHFPQEWQSFLDEREIRKAAADALEFHLVLKPIVSPRIRLGVDSSINTLSHIELLKRYCESVNYESSALPGLLETAAEVMKQVENANTDGLV